MLGFLCLQVTIEDVVQRFLSSGLVALIVAVGTASFVIYVRLSRRTATPAFDLGLFETRTFRAAVLGGSLCRIGVNAQPFLLTLMFQIVFGMSPLESGSLTFASALGALITRPLMVPMLKLLGFRLVMRLFPLGSSFSLAGCTLFGPHTPHALICAYLAVSAMGTSILLNAQNMLIYSDVSGNKLSSSVSVAAVAQQFSMSLGISLAVIVLSQFGHPDLLARARFDDAFLVMAALPLASLALFSQLRPTDGADVSGHRPAAASRRLRAR